MATINLTISTEQRAALKRGIALRVAECRSMIEALESTGAGKTAIANFWRDQLTAALELQMIVSRA